MADKAVLHPAAIVSKLCRFFAIGITALTGLGALVATPMMLILGAWGGSDSGSVLYGLLMLVALPWALYIACSAGAIFALTHNRPFLALIAALPTLIVEAYVMWRMNA